MKKNPAPRRWTNGEKLSIVRAVRAYQQQHGCNQRKAILDLGYKPETVHHWITKELRGELVDSADNLANAIDWVDKGYPITTAAIKGGVTQAELIKALQQRPAKPRHFAFS